MRIIGYQYEADLRCVRCAVERFGKEPDRDWVREDATDEEGNPVHPIFSTDEIDEDAKCGDCGDAI